MAKKFKKQIGRRLLVATLSTAMLLGSSMTVFAAEPQSTEPIDVAMVSTTDEAAASTQAGSEVADQLATPRSISGFNYTDTVGSINTFYVNVSGSASTGHVTLKTEYFASSSAKSYISVYRPDGSTIRTDVLITGNNETKFSFSNAPSGNYKIVAYVPLALSGRIDAWFY